MDIEIHWHPVYLNYGCDKFGNIYSKCFNPWKNRHSEILDISPVLNPDGYLHITVYKDSVGKVIRGHKFVIECFEQRILKLSTKIGGLTIHHINGMREDNRYENLQLVTVSENVRMSK